MPAGLQTPVQQDLSSRDQSSLQHQAGTSSHDASVSVADGTVPAIKRYMYSDGKVRQGDQQSSPVAAMPTATVSHPTSHKQPFCLRPVKMQRTY